MSKYCIQTIAIWLAVLFLIAAKPVMAEDNYGDVVYDANTDTPLTHSVNDGYVNHGTVEATGRDNAYLVHGMSISGGFINHGTVTAMGGGIDTATNGSTGIYLNSGGFANHGMMTATGGVGNRANYSGGQGVYIVEGDYTNHGTAIFTGGDGYEGRFSDGGRALYIRTGNFINYDTVTVTSGIGNGGNGGSGVMAARE